MTASISAFPSDGVVIPDRLLFADGSWSADMIQTFSILITKVEESSGDAHTRGE